MVCAESSASFSKTAAFLMSSLGEATERVTSMVRCSIGTVWVWLSPDCDECGAAAELPIQAGTHRATCCGTEAASCARVGRHGKFYSTLSGTQKWRRLRVKQPSAKK